MSFFFFQAEDGIRDDVVTGVHMCAVPLSLAIAKLEFRDGRSCLDDIDRFMQVVNRDSVDRLCKHECSRCFCVIHYSSPLSMFFENDRRPSACQILGFSSKRSPCLPTTVTSHPLPRASTGECSTENSVYLLTSR